MSNLSQLDYMQQIGLHQKIRELTPGFTVSLVAAAAASFLSEHYGAPVMLFALLLGMGLNFLAVEGKCKAGIEFTAKTVMRVGIALLGMRITLGQITALGWQPVALVIILIIVTISVSIFVAKWIGFQKLFGMLTGGEELPRFVVRQRHSQFLLHYQIIPIRKKRHYLQSSVYLHCLLWQ